MSGKLDDDAPPIKLWRFTLGSRRVSVDAGHLAFVTALAVWVLWYLFDARDASKDIQNLGLIQPVALALIVVWALIAYRTISIDPVTAPEPEVERKQIPAAFAWRIAGSMALLALYVAIATFIGFDVAILVYVAAALYLLGERNPITLIALPLIFCVIVVYLFNTVLATPLPIFFDSLVFGNTQ
jgi:hypothetical protein